MSQVSLLYLLNIYYSFFHICTCYNIYNFLQAMLLLTDCHFVSHTTATNESVKLGIGKI